MMALPARDLVAPVEPASPSAPSFRAVFAENVAFVLRTVRRLGVRDGDVEDVAQDVFVVVHRKLETWDRRCAIRTWLFGVVFRVVSDYRRRASVVREVITDRLPEGSTGATEAEGDAQIAALMRALESLDEQQRAVFVLYELEGMAMKEVAEAMACPLFTAYTRLRAARRRVLDALDATEQAEGTDG